MARRSRIIQNRLMSRGRRPRARVELPAPLQRRKTTAITSLVALTTPNNRILQPSAMRLPPGLSSCHPQRSSLRRPTSALASSRQSCTRARRSSSVNGAMIALRTTRSVTIATRCTLVGLITLRSMAKIGSTVMDVIPGTTLTVRSSLARMLSIVKLPKSSKIRQHSKIKSRLRPIIPRWTPI